LVKRDDRILGQPAPRRGSRSRQQCADGVGLRAVILPVVAASALTTLRKVALVVALLLAVLVAAIFAYSNPAQIAVDLGVIRLENVPVALAFVVCLAVGWVFGIASAGVLVWRARSERRRLRRELRLAEAEVKSLRSLPLQDAD
jgi:uncharacterized integral membrane protein